MEGTMCFSGLAEYLCTSIEEANQSVFGPLYV